MIWGVSGSRREWIRFGEINEQPVEFFVTERVLFFIICYTKAFVSMLAGIQKKMSCGNMMAKEVL